MIEAYSKRTISPESYDQYGTIHYVTHPAAEILSAPILAPSYCLRLCSTERPLLSRGLINLALGSCGADGRLWL